MKLRKNCKHSSKIAGVLCCRNEIAMFSDNGPVCCSCDYFAPNRRTRFIQWLDCELERIKGWLDLE